MALRYERVYIRDTTPISEVKEFSVKHIQKIIDLVTSSHSEEERESVIFRVSWDGEYLDFVLRDDHFTPIEGSVRILNNANFLCQFDAKALYDLIKDSTAFSIFEGEKPLDFSSLDIFTCTKLHITKDYIKMLNDLEKEGIISVSASINSLSNTKKRFRFKKVRDQVKYGIDYYEADSLGGSLVIHITEAIEQEWIQLKNREGEV